MSVFQSSFLFSLLSTFPTFILMVLRTMKTNQYTCKKCDYSVDHPVDNCPVCDAVFYWMVRPVEVISEEQKARYVAKMNSMMEEPNNTSYLLHGDRVWLPHSFWQRFPSGDPLSQFKWIKDLQLVQYRKNAGEEKSTEQVLSSEGSEFDTNPSLQVIGSDAKDPRSSDSFHPIQTARSETSFFRDFLGPISVGLALILFAAAYFSLTMGRQLNLADSNQMHDSKNNVELQP